MAQDNDIFRTGNDVIASFRRQMDRLFDQFAGGFPTRIRQHEGRGRLQPLTDITEDDTSYRIVVEIPGIDPKNLEVNVAGQSLTIRAQQHEENQQEGRSYLLNERSSGAIERQFRIPEDVDENQISAEFRNGVLALTLRKSPQAQKRQRVEIKVS